ncbi:hypothetical protein HMI55_003682 [Coelomomyces lativittatus]|nr:hypothetical protein HMI55_003682 [Coelomomyces lativittatus]
MACLQGKIFEEEEELESNPYLPRKYPRTLLIDYLTALFDLPSSGPFHVLLNYELVLHMVYVHEDPLQAYQFLETFIFSHPYNELPMFLLLMGTLALYLAQLQFTYTSISNKEDTSMVDAYPNLTTPPNISSLNRSLLEFNSDAFRYLKISKTMFTKLTSMRLSSLDFGLYLQQYSTLMAKLMEYYKQIDGWGVEGSGMDSSCEWMHGHSLSEPSSENPLSNSSSTTATEDKLEIFLEVFDFKCSDEKKWKELVTKLNRERERIPDLFKYRRTWWFSFHFSHDESNPILLTYKSIIAYWAIPEVYIHLKKKIWKDFKSVPKELHHLFIKFRIRIRDVVWSYKRDKLQKST